MENLGIDNTDRDISEASADEVVFRVRMYLVRARYTASKSNDWVSYDAYTEALHVLYDNWMPMTIED